MAAVGQQSTVEPALGGPTPDGQHEVAGRSPAQIFWRNFRRDRFALGGIVFLVFLILIAVFAPWISEHVAHTVTITGNVYEKDSMTMLSADTLTMVSK